MPPFASRMLHDITHWPVTGTDGYGGFTFDTGVEVKGRWEDKGELFLDEDNEEQISNAIVYLEIDVAIGDFLAQGLHNAVADPTTLTGDNRSYRARMRNKTTDLRNLVSLRKVFL